MIKTGVFLQVRISSQRLYGKALLDLAGKPVIWHAMRALEQIPAAQYAILTDEESAPHFSRVAAERGFDVFVGDPEDVLERYSAAVRYYGVDEVVRATGDNPMVSAQVARRSIALRRDEEADFAGITGTPYGTGVEVINGYALLDLASWTKERYDREHVSPGLYRNPDRYRVVTREVDRSMFLPELRVTLDTPEDYTWLTQIFGRIYHGDPIEVTELVAFAQDQQESSA